ncbi:hypothetical protein BO78DRAFT_453543 [Aspergillus sclerotiicarbonarius CBS 121057]|uniref:CHAT domain-containing protein n=1 Tax=Aspergillus sclerotiicarbonarius (strain CBS 121057 / IBT 28362) TaxID=1448318 RepID=A0A319DXX6_ASPSB|nr:hypothetical protein BO78DRAFT_453543 [Aspergillus sclerotiicarbonarius CBS 121057]
MDSLTDCTDPTSRKVVQDLSVVIPHPPESNTNDIAMALGQEYVKTRDVTKLDECIQLFRQLVNGDPENPHRPVYLSNLGHALGLRYSKIERRSDLEEAVDVLRWAREVSRPTDTIWPGILNNLGMRLGQYYDLTEETKYLDEAIEMSEAALDATQSDNQDRARRLHNLGLSLSKRYRCLHDPVDLDRAICVTREAVKITPAGYAGRAQWFTNLGDATYDKYRVTNPDADLEESLRMTRRGLQVAVRGDSAWPVWLHNFALRLRAIYKRAGNLEYLREAIDMARQSLAATSADDPERRNRSLNLANCFLEDRYLRTQARLDLTESIRILRLAVKAFPAADPERATSLINLGNSLARYYALAGSVDDLQEFLQVSWEAVTATPAQHHAKAERLANVALRLKDRYRRFRAHDDIKDAIDVAQQAIHAVPSNHPIQGACLRTVGVMFLERYRVESNMSDWQTAKDYFTQALAVSNCSVSVRIGATRELLSLPGIANDPAAYRIATDAVKLIPQLTPRSVQHADRQHLLADAVGVASDAAALALHTGHGTKTAIQLLEAGRGLIAAASFEQTDIDKLTRINQDLANAYVQAETQARIRAETEQELLSLTQKIRLSMPDFQRFLLPASEDEMLAAAKHGPVVMLNVSSHRCDALIVDAAGIRPQPLRLPLLSKKELDAYSMPLASLDTLQWLWDRIVSPVLASLGDTAWEPDCQVRRVWWIPTGELTRFPLHAAGYHQGGTGHTALDRVVSSYAASMNAIIHERRQSATRSDVGLDPASQWGLLAVAMEETPGQSVLPHARTEISEVIKVLGDRATALPCRASKEDVLSALERCKIFHFAGHGSVNPTHPLQSTLLLEDWTLDPLTVGSLLDVRLSSAATTLPFLAYLSACGTGQTRGKGSMDESIHLANACQLAGFRHVIGTLWNVNDALCVSMARLIYQALREERTIQDQSVSLALHRATRTLRNDWIQEVRLHDDEDDYDDFEGVQGLSQDRFAYLKQDTAKVKAPLWIPYVHFGV